MTAIRHNLLTNDTARDQFLQGMVLLDQEMPGITAADVQSFLQNNVPHITIQGLNQQLSTYDLFVLWHIVAMSIPLEIGNAAHSGPIFLPWHRMYLIRLEEELQRVLNDVDFGLPYWDWAADGELSIAQQLNADIWSAQFIGNARGEVTSGAFDAMRVRLFNFTGNAIASVNPRRITRDASNISARRLPRKAEVQFALDAFPYDEPDWDNNNNAHRNVLEGWHNSPALHNRVHVWIGGDMGPGSSPNDPVFFLNHCNVDRIWEAWMMAQGRDYRPQIGEGPQGHRIDDSMVAILGESLRPIDVVDPSQWYQYDDLGVAT
jgi:tyrosinase